MNVEIARTVEVAAQALAAARAAATWADSAFATTTVREFLAMMASHEARRAREGARWLVGLVDHYRAHGESAYAEEIAKLAQVVEGSAAGAELAARRVGKIAADARKLADQLRAKRSSAIKVELLREHTDRTDVIEVLAVPGPTPEVVETRLLETRWPSGKVTGRVLAHPVELTETERAQLSTLIVQRIVTRDQGHEVRHG